VSSFLGPAFYSQLICQLLAGSVKLAVELALRVAQSVLAPVGAVPANGIGLGTVG